MERASLIKPGFSTADAEYPEIRQEDGDVVLRFKDWQQKDVEVFFADPIAFRWQMAESFHEGERDDSSYEILNSDWLALHVKQCVIAETEEYKHFKFNFNGCGQFEILSLCYTVKI